MKTLLPIIEEELATGRRVALATVLATKGSAPRGAGACQLLTQAGHAAGTVGGGVLEHRALTELKALLTDAATDTPIPPCVTPVGSAIAMVCPCHGASTLQEYALTQDEVLSLGMVCGGNVTLLYQLLTPDLLPLFRALRAMVAQGQRNVWLVRWLEYGKVTCTGISHGVASDAPDMGTGLVYARKPVWQPMPDEAEPAACSCFTQPVQLVSHAYLFGGGHVAQCVAPLLALLDFSPIVYDDRVEFADRALFPTADGVVCAPFAQASERLRITGEDVVVIMTRGHVNDLVILSQALRTPAYYIGLIGSRSKIVHTKQMLLAQGFTEADFARVRTPVGLPIKAETPMEIAVSVAAEMILARAEYAENGPQKTACE